MKTKEEIIDILVSYANNKPGRTIDGGDFEEIAIAICDTPDVLSDEDCIMIRATRSDIPSVRKYKDWTRVSRLLGYGLYGVEVMEIPTT
jgi:hypothetical protein